jgi:gas vesicle protein
LASNKTKRRGFLVGAIVGGIAGLLLAPGTGKQMREKLFGEEFDLDQQKERLRQAMGAGRESAVASSNDLKQKIEETRERLRRQAGADDEE